MKSLLSGCSGILVACARLVSVIVLALPHSAATDDPSVPVLFFGDSLTAGMNVAKDESYPAVVERLAKADGILIHAINGGMSGETSAGGLRRIEWYLKQPFAVFVLALGANDGLRGLPVAEMEKNLAAIIEKVRAEHPEIPILLAGVKLPPTYGNFTDEFTAVFPRVAKKYGAALLPFLLEGVAGEPELNLDDGIHPNGSGYAKVGTLVWRALRPLLPAKASVR